MPGLARWLLAVLLLVPAPAGSEDVVLPPPPEAVEERAIADVLRARALSRLGRTAEALATYEALLERRARDLALREEYAEFLLDAGLVERAVAELDALLASAPTPHARRLRARADLERGRPDAAAARLEALLAEAPDDRDTLAALARAELARGHWRRTLDLWNAILERAPDDEDVRRAYREVAAEHASRLDVRHHTLFQERATSHVSEVAWRTWVHDRWWIRPGVRAGVFLQDAAPGIAPFTEDMQAALLMAGYRPRPRWELYGGLEGARQADAFRTTLRLGGVFDDARATRASLDLAVREPLTNPVTAVPRRGATDRVTAELRHRLLDRLVAVGRYERRMHRAAGTELGTAWDLVGRVELELLRGRLDLVLAPFAFLSDYRPAAGPPLREQVSFLGRQDILGVDLTAAASLGAGVRLLAGVVGRRDVFRDVTAWEVLGEVRWRMHPGIEGHVFYTRNSESSRIGGKEESIGGGILFFH